MARYTHSELVTGFCHVAILSGAALLVAGLCIWTAVASQSYWNLTIAAAACILLSAFSFHHVQVDDHAIYVRYLGICVRKVQLSDVLRDAVIPYDWKVYGGWGIKRACSSKPQWAYSCIGVPLCVRIETENLTVDLSSHQPENLASAIGSSRLATGMSA